MFVYWLMFLLPAWTVLQPMRLKAAQARIAMFLFGVLFAVLMGFRHEVGGDWANYYPMFLNAGAMDFSGAISRGDPGYSVLNWLVYRNDGSIYWVNFVCAVMLMLGTIVFSRRQPNPWLAILASVPYMLIVVGMGYTRQSVALGCALMGLTALGDRRVRRFVVWIAVGTLFHKSAILLMPIAALAASRNRWLTSALVVGTTALTYYLLLQDSAEDLWANYVDTEMQSQGGAIRVAMNVVPALVLIGFRKRLVPDESERRLWLWIAAAALLCVPLVGFASTAVDRVALYLIPLQMFVFARLPRLTESTRARTFIVLSIIGYYAAVLFVWLHYSTHSLYWVPYQFMPVFD